MLNERKSNNNPNFIKIKSFWFSKDNITKSKGRSQTESNYVQIINKSDKRLIFKTYKDYLKLKNRRKIFKRKKL